MTDDEAQALEDAILDVMAKDQEKTFLTKNFVTT